LSGAAKGQGSEADQSRRPTQEFRSRSLAASRHVFDTQGASECPSSEQLLPEVTGWLRRKKMANGNGRQIVPPPTPMKITQIAVVVRDIEAALKTYTETLGWGPWSVFDYKPPLLHDTRVNGEPVEYRMIGAEASVDGLGFELIQPVSGPSIYQEFLDSHGEGVQHIACMKHSEQDSSLVQEHWRSNGAEVLMSGRIGDSIEFYYLDTAPMLKFVLESGSGHAIDLKPTYVYP
jgi:methylmalonyl-CoA/ethylmalonyl-CoA epimerase